MITTMKLNENWDIDIDKSGNFNIVADEYAIAQSVANALRAFTKDMVFDRTKGVDHFSTDISTRPNLAIIADIFEKEACTVQGVTLAKCSLERFENRTVLAQMLLQLENGKTINLLL